MEYAVLGWPEDEPTLRLDYRRFAYAGKFVMSNTGKAVVRDASAGGVSDDAGATDFDTDVVAALAFNADRTDAATLWYRYVTVRADRKGAGLGPRLARYVAPQAAARGYERLRIAVNNPFAYEAMYKAGFAWTGRETGVAELVLERPAGDAAASETADPITYQRGLDRYRDRDLGDPEASFLAGQIGSDPPAVVAAPESAAGSAPDPDA
ncbi:GNAT family N-acetyltransferase [Halobellus sp. Atlit-31R]|nr:GNAT family N-acetyltransferase [Halobellus sp. Atlit-31R]